MRPSIGKEQFNKISFRTALGMACLSLIILWITVPVMRGVATSSFYKILFAVLMVFVLALLARNLRVNTEEFVFIASFTVFICIYAVDFLSNRGDMNIFDFVNYFVLFFCIIVSKIISEHHNDKIERYILYLFYAMCIVSLITTIIGLQTDANAIRLLTSSSTSEDVDQLLRLKNIGGYDFLYSLLILCPVLIQLAKQTDSRKIRIATIIWLILAMICIVLSNFTIAYLFVGIIIVFSVLPSRFSTLKKLVISAIALVVLFYLLRGVLVMYLNFIGSHSNSVMTQSRMRSMELFLNGGISLFDMNDRFVLARNSIRTFWEHPIFGGGAYFRSYSIVSGHSAWLDELARNGIVGFAAFAVMMISGARNVLSFDNAKQKNTMTIIFVFYILLGLVNNVFGYMITLVVFVITPLLSRQGIKAN